MSGDGELSGRVAMVTGATGGIGRAVVRRFAEQGAAIVVTDLDDKAVREVVEHGTGDGSTVIGRVMDVTDAAQVESFLDTPLEQWDHIFDVIVKGAVHGARAVLPAMIEHRRGSIINIASVNGLSFYGDPAYSAAKAALISLTRTLAAMYGDSNVRTNAIAPGTVRGPIWTDRLARDPDTLTKLARWYPLGRVGEPPDIAEAACFLASDRAAWISGAVLPVDGGLGAGNVEMARDTGGF
jgi:NAD(P)-dependent dehydrogenase (short-subunit alcohol dehydrogenase family)